MSYHIVYDKQFIKVGNGYLPFILSGDNNLYDFSSTGSGVGRRSRNFNLLCRVDGEFIQTKEMFDKHINNQHKYYYEMYYAKDNTPISEYEDSFGFAISLRINGSIPSFNQYKSLYKTGMDKALTMEQIQREYDRYFHIKFSTFSEKKEGDINFNENCYSTDKLIEMINKAKQFEIEHKKTVYLTPSFSENDPKRLRKRFFNIEKKKTFIEQGKTVYKVILEGYGAFERFTRGYTRYSNKGKVFTSQGMAKKIVEKIEQNNPTIKCNIINYKYNG